MENPKQEMEFGPLMGVIIIVILLLIGAVYFLNQRIDKLETQKKMLQNIVSTTTVIDLGTTTIMATSSK